MTVSLGSYLVLLRELSISLNVLDLGQNKLSGRIPTWVGKSLISLKISSLSSYNGSIPSQLCHLQSLQILDLSGNEILGTIPRWLYNFTAMDEKEIDPDNRMQRSYLKSSDQYTAIRGLMLVLVPTMLTM